MRMTRVVVRIAGGFAIALLVLEGSLQAASRFVGDRGSERRAGIGVLAVGDSHTYGAGVAAEESYPAQLQQQLDAVSPGVFSVTNLGVPGMSTTQVRNRLAGHVARYEPGVVVVWCGVNNAWNRAELGAEAPSWVARLDGVLHRSRLYRAVRVGLHDRRLERAVARVEGEETERANAEAFALGEENTWVLRHGEAVEKVVIPRGREPSEAAVEERALRDYRAMVAWLRSRGVAAVLVTYPVEAAAFGAANQAMRRVAEEEDGVAVVESSLAVLGLPPEDKKLLYGAHPTPAMYREIARAVAAAVLAAGGPGV